MENNQQTNPKKENKSSYTGWIIAVAIIIGLTLPFHYVPEPSMVFPKEHLTFSNTLILQEDIDRIIERYNKASLFEKQAINQEPLVRKLFDKGLIHRIDD